MTLRLAFMGTPPFSVAPLAALISAGHDVAAVYSQPPRPAGRGQAEQKSAVQAFAEANGIGVRTPKSLRNAEAQAAFAALDLDAAVVVAYGLILPKPILDAPKLGCVNIHASLLPRWRGAAPIQRAIMAGDTESGVMTMLMDEGLDTGPVLMAERLAIPPEMTAGQLHDALAPLGADLIVRTMAALGRGGISPQAQREAGMIYAAKISKDETRLNWADDSEAIRNRVRGLAPAPGAWTTINGERVKVLKAALADGTGASGTALDDALTIGCGNGALRLETLQRPGRGPMQAADLLRGFTVPKGTLLS